MLLILITINTTSNVNVFAVPNDYTDPFSYYNLDSDQSNEEFKGIFLKHNVGRSLYGSDPIENDFIKNYDYTKVDNNLSIDVKSPKNVPLVDTFDDLRSGYLEHKEWKENATDQVYTKKSVSKTDEPHIFEIEVDVIGGATLQHVKKEVDIVFVIDRSSSMVDEKVPGTNKTRWQVFKEEFTYFVNEFAGINDEKATDVKISLVGFGSVPNSGKTENYPYASVARFGDSLFSGNPSQLVNHELITTDPYWSGTPTYLGVEIGSRVLKNTLISNEGRPVNSGLRANSEKIIITITDGEPTFTSYVNLPINPRIGLLKPDLRPRSLSTPYRNSFNYELRARDVASVVSYSDRYNGNGVTSGSGASVEYNNHLGWQKFTHTETSIINSFRGLENVTKYSIGFGFGGANATPSVKSLLNLLGERTDNVLDAADHIKLREALSKIGDGITKTKPFIEQAILTDPMSDYVELVENSIKEYSLDLTRTNGNQKYNLTEQALDISKNSINKSIENNTITYSNITLSGKENIREGFRFKYQVRLKPEYWDGNFYPTNGPTRAIAKDYDNYISFPVPSVRATPVIENVIDLTVKKVWIDDNNKWNLRKDIKLALQFSKVNEDNWFLDNKYIFEISKDSEILEHTFKDIPFRINHVDYKVRLVELVDNDIKSVEGYSLGTVNYLNNYLTFEDIIKLSKPPLTITNTLLYKDIKINKYLENQATPFSNIKFTLKDSSNNTIIDNLITDSLGEFNLNLPIGQYKLIEDIPLGYKGKDLSFEIKQDQTTKELFIDMDECSDCSNYIELDNNQFNIYNYLNDFSLELLKTNPYDDAIEDVEFSLISDDSKYNKVMTTDSDGKLLFENIKPGQYILKELSVNKKYILIEDEIKIDIVKNGLVEISEHPPS